MRPIPTLLTTCLVLPGCLDVADQRAEADGTVGTGSSGALSIEVDHGLAAVRELDGDGARLWASAPSLDLSLANAGDGPIGVDLRVENVLPDAELSAGTPVTERPGGRPTEKVWRVEVPGETTVRVRIRAPDAGDATPWSFVLFGDVQEAIDRVQDLFTRMNEEEEARFAIIVGDLTDVGSAEELARFQRELRTLDMPCFSTLGNHELAAPGAPYHRFFGRGSYRFDFRGVRFVIVDSASATIADRTHGWIRRWIRESPHDLVVTGMHVPLQDPVGARSGSFASRDEASALLADLASGGVDATFYGHVHSYYAFRNAGIPAYISGGGGAIPERWDGIGRHYLRVQVDPARERVETTLVRIDED